jgi:lysophospholipase L1-like esterase
MPITFHKPLNNVATTVAAGRSAGSPSIVVATGTGASFGSTFPLIATASRAGAVLAIFEVTGRSADTLTVSGAIEGTTDVALLVGDVLEMRPTALAISEVQAALNTLEAAAVTLPYATTLQVTNAGRFAMWGDSVTAGSGGGGTSIPGVLSALESRVGYNAGVGGETAAQIATRFLADTARHTWPTIIEAGRNDVVAVGYSQSATLAAIASMTDAMDAVGNTIYLVLTVLNAGDEPSGSATYVKIAALNAAILAAYPDNSLDWRPLFVADYDPGITQDVTDHGNDVPPSSLRSDTFHPNAAGYTLLAGHIDDNRAAISVAAMPVEPSALGSLALDDANSVHRTGAETIAGVKTFSAGPVVEFDGAELRWLQGDGITGFRVFAIGDGTVYQQVTDDGFTAHGRSTVTVGAYASGSPLGLYGNVGVHVNDAGGGNLSVDGSATAAYFTTVLAPSSIAGYTLTRRDTGAEAYVLYSSAGEFGIFNNPASVNVLTIAVTTHAATFLGGVTAPSFAGDGSALTGLTKAQVGLGSVEDTALSTWAGSANLTTVGTIATGTWQGTAIADTYIASAGTWNAKQAAGNYLTALTGDVAASGPGSAAATLASVVTAGTSPKVTYDAKGRVTAGAALVAGDIPNLDAAKVTTGTFGTARIGTGTAAAGKYVDGAAGAWTALPASTGANALGTYIVQTATNAPANAQVLASLATGMLKVTTTTGVVSIGVAGTDYVTPTGSGAGLTALNASNLTTGTVGTARLATGTASASTFHRGDGTWAAASGTGDMFANMVNTVVSVTTTTTLTTTAFAKLHVCTGTTADYTVTLPAVSGNTGKFIGFRMSGALTKFVTLDANASETIDGSLTRLMWANETAIIYCDGTTWTKISGKSLPMTAVLALSSTAGATTFANNTNYVIPFDVTLVDNTGAMADLVGHQIVVKRTSVFLATVFVRWSSLPSDQARLIGAMTPTGGGPFIIGLDMAGLSGGYPVETCTQVVSLSAAAGVNAIAVHFNGSNLQLYGDSTGDGNLIALVEVPQW